LTKLPHDDKSRAMLSRKECTFSGVFDPSGALITEPLGDEEGIVYADIDLQNRLEPKQLHDILGHYNRFDVFNLTLNKRSQLPISINCTEESSLSPFQGPDSQHVSDGLT